MFSFPFSHSLFPLILPYSIHLSLTDTSHDVTLSPSLSKTWFDRNHRGLFKKSMSLPGHSFKNWIHNAARIKSNEEEKSNRINREPCRVLVRAQDCFQSDGRVDLRALDLAHVIVIIEHNRKSIAPVVNRQKKIKIKQTDVTDCSRLSLPHDFDHSALSKFHFISASEELKAIENTKNRVSEKVGQVGGDNVLSRVREQSGWAAVEERRQRHSIAGSTRPSRHVLATTALTSTVFSTAVISGAASAPNLTDILPNTTSLSGTIS